MIRLRIPIAGPSLQLVPLTNNLTRIAIYDKGMNMDDNLFNYTDFQGVIEGTDDPESRLSLMEINPDIYKILHP